MSEFNFHHFDDANFFKKFYIDCNFNSFTNSYYVRELYKKSSRMNPLKKAQAKHLIEITAAKINLTNNPC